MKNHPHILLPVAVVQCIVPLLFFVAAVVHPCTGNAQPGRLATLQQQLKNAKHDTDKVNTYYSISRYYWAINADSGLLMAQQSLTLAQKIHFNKGIALAYLSMGVAQESKGELPAALDDYFKALRISQQLGMEGLSGNLYNNIGNVYVGMGNHYAEAKYNYNLAYQIALKQNDTTGFVTFGPLVNIGEAFKLMGYPDSSIAYNIRALAIAEKVNDSASIAIAQFNIGENYITLKQYQLAGNALHRSLRISEKIRDVGGQVYCHNALALMFYYTGKSDSAMFFGLKGLKEAKEAGFADLIEKGYHVLYLLNKQKGLYRQALQYHELETTLKDSLDNTEKAKVIKNIQAQYDLEKKQQQVELLSKDNQLKQAALGRAVTRRNIYMAFAVVLLAAAILLFTNYAQKRKLSAKLKQQNESITQQNKHLEKLVDAKNRLFSIIGHDLRGPVNSVNSLLNMAKTNQLPEVDTQFVITKASETLDATAQLLDNLLYWAKSQMENMEASPGYFNIQTIIVRIIALLSHRAAAKNIILSHTVTEPLTVYADGTMIEMVIRNLTENALKFSKAGDAVTISAVLQNNNVIITVKDTGVGIPVEMQPKIFDRSALYTTYGTKKEKGSGLGLLLCLELVELNKGSIGFNSLPGKGSNFYFTIPAAK